MRVFEFSLSLIVSMSIVMVGTPVGRIYVVALLSCSRFP